ncbi:MAG: hypothetical protein ACXWCW_28475 [Burkholderiales bacterium]
MLDVRVRTWWSSPPADRCQGPRAITDLTFLIGYFRTLGWMIGTYEVDLEPRELLDRYWSGADARSSRAEICYVET